MKLMGVNCTVEFWGIVLGLLMLACGLTLFSCANTAEKDPVGVTRSRFMGPQSEWVPLSDGRKVQCVTYSSNAVSCDWAGAK